MSTVGIIGCGFMGGMLVANQACYAAMAAGRLGILSTRRRPPSRSPMFPRVEVPS